MFQKYPDPRLWLPAESGWTQASSGQGGETRVGQRHQPQSQCACSPAVWALEGESGVHSDDARPRCACGVCSGHVHLPPGPRFPHLGGGGGSPMGCLGGLRHLPCSPGSPAQGAQRQFSKTCPAAVASKASCRKCIYWRRYHFWQHEYIL